MKLPTKSSLLEQPKDHGTIVITDKKQIAEIAKQHVFYDIDSITQITCEFRDAYSVQESRSVGNGSSTDSERKASESSAKIYNVKDLGEGFSYWDDYDDSIYDGPAEAIEPLKKTVPCSYTANTDVDPKLIEAAVGFTFSSGQVVQQDNTITIPADRRIESREFVNYQMKSFDIGYDKDGFLVQRGSGTAFRPVGFIFLQIIYLR